MPDTTMSSDGKGFVTLQTNVTFDTPKAYYQDDRPLVDRRHIENEVRVLRWANDHFGGLRRKDIHDKKKKFPFSAIFPGIGKLFGSIKAHQ